MMAWSTEHDEWIAEHCEGWRRITDGPCAGMWKRPDRVENIGVPHYITDPAAAIRAAEVWQTSGPDRRILLTIDLDGRRVDAYNGTHWFIVRDRVLSAALAQALYRATGGPA